MKTVRWFGAAVLGALSVGMVGACGGDDGGTTADEGNLTEGVVCKNPAAYPNAVLNEALKTEPGALGADGQPVYTNYTSWPVYAPNSQGVTVDPAVVAPRSTAAEARKNLASRFGGSCTSKVEQHLKNDKPNVYVYFTGYGGATQNNSIVDEGAIIHWINQRDPKALIYSISWNCAGSPDSFCADNAASLALRNDSPEFKSMSDSLKGLTDEAPKVLQTIKDFSTQQQEGYDAALSHAMQLAAQLVDQLLVANDDGGGDALGDIHFLGYSMGAHAAAQVLVQDFTSDASVGYKWSRRACEDGSDTCTVAALKKVKWSLGMGLSGWSDALQAYNGFDASGRPAGRAADDLAQNQNGGLLKIKAERYHGKLNVLNRRMDPTGNSDDTFQRGLNDVLFGDYNHYSHDYSLPLFVNAGFVRALDAFLESPTATDVKELGTWIDNAGLVDFDGCPASGNCVAGTGYLAHAQNRSHQRLGVIDTPPVPTTDGVAHADRKANRAVAFGAPGAVPIPLKTFDQEDLRGGVELYFRPKFDLASGDVHGLFSYGACQGSTEDLMPQAYFQGGKLIFSMNWLGQPYAVEVDARQAGLATDQWSHLSFTWELPVESMTKPHASKADVEAAKPSMAADLQKHGLALMLANGLRKPSPTTYKRQKGEGVLRIYVNGAVAATAPLGTADSQRECLAANQVLSSKGYQVDGQNYPAYLPYAGYNAAQGDVVALGPGQVIGSKCKAYRVRNETVFFGCAKSPEVSASGDMDDILLVWGPGRTDYEDVNDDGSPSNWPIGVTYDATPYKAR